MIIGTSSPPARDLAHIPDVDAEMLSRQIRRYTREDQTKFRLFRKLPDGRFGLQSGGRHEADTVINP